MTVSYYNPLLAMTRAIKKKMRIIRKHIIMKCVYYCALLTMYTANDKVFLQESSKYTLLHSNVTLIKTKLLRSYL